MPTLVCFHAHPDDESIATGGTILRAIDDGHRVVLVVATRGECGEVADGFLDPGETLGERRVLETMASAEVLGVSRVEFLGYRDSGMIGEDTNDDPTCFWQADLDEAATRLAEILGEEAADVLTIYDERGGYGHPDHIQVHRVGLRAAEIAGVGRVYESTMNSDVIRAQMALAVEAGLMPPDELPPEDDMFGMPDSVITHAVDVAEHTPAKRASMRAHASQIGEDSFFLQMPEDLFAGAFGTEWFIEHGIAPDPDRPKVGWLF